MMRLVCALAVCTLAACNPSDVLDVPVPTGVIPASALTGRNGAEQLESTGIVRLAQGFSQEQYGVLEWSESLADEFQFSFVYFEAPFTGPDARRTTAGGGYQEMGDNGIQNLMASRFVLLTALPSLEQYEPPTGRAKVALAFALIGYTELLVAEDYCAGLPLATPTSSGVRYGTPLTTDSLLGVAEAQFDSAVAYAGADSVAAPLAHEGLARTRLDRANFAGAATAAAAVPTGFVYNAELEPGGINSLGLTLSNIYAYATQNLTCGEANTADRKGGNGLNYVSANDPRLVLNATIGETCDGYFGGLADSVWYFPAKFGTASNAVPLATGAEARLIEAEAALHAGQVGAWAADLNALRANASGTYLALAAGMTPLTPDSTTTANAATRVDVMFREKAFWLYGTGTRLGDMRRLIRQYGRDQSTVFPVGPYPFASSKYLPSPISVYGTDVNLTLPTAAGSLSDPNANYKGCIDKSA